MAAYPDLNVLALRRPHPSREGLYQWLVSNGPHAGRWTTHFGLNCLADLELTRAIICQTHEDTPGSVILEYKIFPGGSHILEDRTKRRQALSA